MGRSLGCRCRIRSLRPALASKGGSKAYFSSNWLESSTAQQFTLELHTVSPPYGSEPLTRRRSFNGLTILAQSDHQIQSLAAHATKDGNRLPSSQNGGVPGRLESSASYHSTIAIKPREYDRRTPNSRLPRVQSPPPINSTPDIPSGAPRHRRQCAIALTMAIAMLCSCSREPAVLGDANYSTLQLASACAETTPGGAAGTTEDLETSNGVRFSVRTPRNYDATRAHPLLVVLAPAGYDRHRSERYAGLTTSATSVGFVVAYADHIALTMAAFPQLGEIPKLVSARWCIDTARVSFAGHSDGGSSAGAMAFLNASSIRPAAVVVSGAGFRAEDLRVYSCPAGIDAMIVHSRGDERFPLPAFGREPAQWWAACNQCAPTPPAADADGCMQFSRCAAGTRVRYCEVATPHEQWPGLEGAMLKFVTQARN